MPSHHTAAALWVVVLVVGLLATPPTVAQETSQDGASTATPTPTVETPQSTNESDESPGLAPGVGPNGSVDLTVLLATHERVLRTEGFHAVENLTVVRDGAVFVTTQIESEAAAGGVPTRVVHNQTVVDDRVTIEHFRNESVVATRVVRAGSVSTQVTRVTTSGGANRSVRSTARVGQRVGPVIAHHAGHEDHVPGRVLGSYGRLAGDFSLTNQSDRTVTLTAPVVLRTIGTDPTGNLTLVVSRRGVVRRASVTVEYPPADRETYRLTVEPVGVTEVSRPPWVDRALVGTALGRPLP